MYYTHKINFLALESYRLHVSSNPVLQHSCYITIGFAPSHQFADRIFELHSTSNFMCMVFFETDYVLIKYLPDYRSAEIIWKGEAFTPEQYRQTILKAQDLVELHDVDNLLADLRKEKEVSEENRTWIKRVVLPHFEALGLKRFAFIYTGNVLSKLHAEGLIETIMTMNFEVQHFDNTEQAHEWFMYYTAV